MFNIEITNKYKDELQQAMHNNTMFYAYAYHDGPDVGMRRYGGKHNRVADIILPDNTVWLIAGDTYLVGSGTSSRLNRCAKISCANPENLVVELRAQGMVKGEIYQIPLGLYLVAEKIVVDDDFGLLRLK
jgi:hypothetical protein